MENSHNMWAKTTCTIKNLNDEPFWIYVGGRELWALIKLKAVGATGCTAAQVGAARLAAYIFKLRKRGVWIETICEANRGEFPGSHARYVLRSVVEISQQIGCEQ